MDAPARKPIRQINVYIEGENGAEFLRQRRRREKSFGAAVLSVALARSSELPNSSESTTCGEFLLLRTPPFAGERAGRERERERERGLFLE